ncbi:DUF4080 domain-containing protein [Fontivita pretiosa]|uniref:B12-binding domain-containing radical SAM protein n=1 Tax=Fontivita pretiosa TaxID=2989684 RepID=UPI003D17E5E5
MQAASQRTDILLTTLNARYAHAAFGLRYLLANLDDSLRPGARIVEFDINQRPIDILEAILSYEPRVLGIGVYIWNALQSEQLVAMLKRVRPDITVVLGGPEVSYETEQQPICDMADYVIRGEADLAFSELCRQLLANRRPPDRMICPALPQLSQLRLPYDLYTDEDLAHRVVYVEASRGCPFKCEFCLSSLDVPVRNVPLDDFLAAMQRLLDRGLRRFKFVDRTFNLNLNVSRAILEFFLARYQPGLFLHFEMIPDRLPEPLRQIIRQYPPGALQFEVGVQTFNEEVAERISRKQDNARLEQNLRFLRTETGVHVHADLIVGLPGEDMDSFGRGFDRLVALGPQEIQVGLLKRLRGTPIVRHDAEWGMVYSPHAPYEILQTKLINFSQMQRLRRFARFWDLIVNSGNFVETAPLIWGNTSAFEGFLRFSDWLYDAAGRQTHGIALSKLIGLVFRYLTKCAGVATDQAAEVLWRDYQRATGKRDCPPVVRPYLSPDALQMRDPRQTGRGELRRDLPLRQARHLGR